LPGFDDLVAAAHASDKQRLFVSSEDFSLISKSQVGELAAKLSDFDVRPILCLRNQLTWSESIFAQACKRGYVKPFGSFIKTLTKNKRTDFGGIYKAWSDQFGHDKMTVLIHENHADISDAFADLMGVEIEARPARKNQSLNERFVKASQIVAEKCTAGELQYDGTVVTPDLMNDISKIMLAAGTYHPQFNGSPVFLKREPAQAYLDRFADMNREIAKKVDLPESYFKVPEKRRQPRKSLELDVDFLIESVFEDVNFQKKLTERAKN
jgi:hypothetical protein